MAHLAVGDTVDFGVAIGDVAAFDDWLMDGAPEVLSYEAAHAQAIMDLASVLEGIGAKAAARDATSLWPVSIALGLAAVLVEWADGPGPATIGDDSARAAVASIMASLRDAVGARAADIDLPTVKAGITASMPEDWRTSW